jgi:hypothetical protein
MACRKIQSDYCAIQPAEGYICAEYGDLVVVEVEGVVATPLLRRLRSILGTYETGRSSYSAHIRQSRT